MIVLFSYVCHSYEYFLLFFAQNYSHVVWQIRDGLQYNPYFPGGAIAMPKMLDDGAIEREDGTPAAEAQVDPSSFFFYPTYFQSF